MKEMLKKLLTMLKPLIKGWTIKGMIALLEKEGYCVCDKKECKK